MNAHEEITLSPTSSSPRETLFWQKKKKKKKKKKYTKLYEKAANI